MPLVLSDWRISVLFHSKLFYFFFFYYEKDYSLAYVNTGLEILGIVKVSF